MYKLSVSSASLVVFQSNKVCDKLCYTYEMDMVWYIFNLLHNELLKKLSTYIGGNETWKRNKNAIQSLYVPQGACKVNRSCALHLKP